MDVYNRIYINWGVFNGSLDSSDSLVQGPIDAYEYQIYATYGDYFDRPYITSLYMTIFISSVLGVLSPIVQVFPAALLLLYVFTQPVFIQLFVVPSREMNLMNYLWEIVFRWQASTVSALFFAAGSNLLTVYPVAYIAYYIYYYGMDYSETLLGTIFGTGFFYLFQLLFNFIIGFVVIAFMEY